MALAVRCDQQVVVGDPRTGLSTWSVAHAAMSRLGYSPAPTRWAHAPANATAVASWYVAEMVPWRGDDARVAAKRAADD